ncbi:MAG: matrixin family metalloprotease, partial [Nanoarchaeota archaeon]|nr:matrixin family metalloprotease [Nanoarchaeota archaeon]
TEQYVLDTTNQDGMTSNFVTSVTSASFETWDSEVAFDVFGTQNTSATVDGPDTVSPDDKNEVMFGVIDSPGVIAVAIIWGIFIGPPSQREIVEYDVVFNDPDYTWGDATINASLMDYQNIATHEFGHAAGLDHPDITCTEETMYAFADFGETKKRDLNAGDIAGITKLYS